MGKRKAGKRTKTGQLSRAVAALIERNPPSQRILDLRELFSFGDVTKGGNIDQDICDGIGRLHRVGLLEGHGVDSLAMRDAGRDFSDLYWLRYNATAPKTGSGERVSRTSNSYDGETADDRRYARMDEALTGLGRTALFQLVVEKQWGDDIVSWADSLVNRELLERGKKVPFMRFPTWEDEMMLKAACVGLVAIAGGVPVVQRMAA